MADPTPRPSRHGRTLPVDVWWTPLGDESVPAADLARLLETWELRRLDTLPRPEDRTGFAAAHALCRVALSRLRPEIPPSRWRLRQVEGGRTVVDGSAGDLELSLSHTRGLVGCAVAAAPLGLDLEDASRTLDLDVLLPQTLSPAERAEWTADLEGASGRFLAYWTAKEALSKALGLGLAVPFPELDLELRTDGGLKLRGMPTGLGDAAGWTIRRLSLAPPHVGAVALAVDAGTPVKLRLHRLGIDELARAAAKS